MKNDLAFPFSFYNPYIVVSCLKRVLFDMLITSHIIILFFLKDRNNGYTDRFLGFSVYVSNNTKMTGHYVLRTPAIPETQYLIV